MNYQRRELNSRQTCPTSLLQLNRELFPGWSSLNLLKIRLETWNQNHSSSSSPPLALWYPFGWRGVWLGVWYYQGVEHSNNTAGHHTPLLTPSELLIIHYYSPRPGEHHPSETMASSLQDWQAATARWAFSMFAFSTEPPGTFIGPKSSTMEPLFPCRVTTHLPVSSLLRFTQQGFKLWSTKTISKRFVVSYWFKLNWPILGWNLRSWNQTFGAYHNLWNLQSSRLRPIGCILRLKHETVRVDFSSTCTMATSIRSFSCSSCKFIYLFANILLLLSSAQ